MAEEDFDLEDEASDAGTEIEDSLDGDVAIGGGDESVTEEPGDDAQDNPDHDPEAAPSPGTEDGVTTDPAGTGDDDAAGDPGGFGSTQTANADEATPPADADELESDDAAEEAEETQSTSGSSQPIQPVVEDGILAANENDTTGAALVAAEVVDATVVVEPRETTPVVDVTVDTTTPVVEAASAPAPTPVVEAPPVPTPAPAPVVEAPVVEAPPVPTPAPAPVVEAPVVAT
ncbi:TPA: hypothetical protein EYO12_00320 [Candidatus Saccharibacteria bacterium]|nr:hypothetical protein [Candidatus Saccharibacteria bacterium]HIO87539.1 hypothetical protein [Candidatus Saccharibacteria bacterium]